MEEDGIMMVAKFIVKNTKINNSTFKIKLTILPARASQSCLFLDVLFYTSVE